MERWFLHAMSSLELLGFKNLLSPASLYSRVNRWLSRLESHQPLDKKAMSGDRILTPEISWMRLVVEETSQAQRKLNDGWSSTTPHPRWLSPSLAYSFIKRKKAREKVREESSMVLDTCSRWNLFWLVASNIWFVFLFYRWKLPANTRDYTRHTGCIIDN